MIRIHPDVDMTNMIALMPEVPQSEKDQLVAYIDANKGGTVAFATFIPSSSNQLTEEQAELAGWFPSEDLPLEDDEGA